MHSNDPNLNKEAARILSVAGSQKPCTAYLFYKQHTKCGPDWHCKGNTFEGKQEDQCCVGRRQAAMKLHFGGR